MSRFRYLVALAALVGGTIGVASPVGAAPPVESESFVYAFETCEPSAFVVGGSFLLRASYPVTDDGDDDVDVGETITYTLVSTAHQNQAGPVTGTTTFELPSGPVTVDYSVADTTVADTYGSTTYTVPEGDAGTVIDARVSGLTADDANGRSVTCTTPEGAGVVGTYVNLPPDAVDDDATTDQDEAVTVDVSANDTLTDDSGTVTGNPPDPTDQDDVSTFVDLTLAADASDGTCVIDGDEITYTPDAGFVGDDSCAYTLTDNDGASDTAVLSVTVVEPPPPTTTTTTTSTTTSTTSTTAPDTAGEGTVTPAATPTVATPTFTG